MARMLPPNEDELRLWDLLNGNDNKAGQATKQEYAELRRLHETLYGEEGSAARNISGVTSDYSQKMVNLLMMMS